MRIADSGWGICDFWSDLIRARPGDIGARRALPFDTDDAHTETRSRDVAHEVKGAIGCLVGCAQRSYVRKQCRLLSFQSDL